MQGAYEEISPGCEFAQHYVVSQGATNIASLDETLSCEKPGQTAPILAEPCLYFQYAGKRPLQSIWPLQWVTTKFPLPPSSLCRNGHCCSKFTFTSSLESS